MDTNWCTYCGKHIDGSDDALYCSEVCRDNDSKTAHKAAGHGDSGQGGDYFLMMQSPKASPLSSPIWMPQMLKPSPSADADLLGVLPAVRISPCHTPAYSARSPMGVSIGSAHGYAAESSRSRSTSLPSIYQLPTV